MEADVLSILSKTRSIPEIEIRPTVTGDEMTLGRLYAKAYFELMDQLPPPRTKTLEDFIKMMIHLFTETSKQKQRQLFGVAWNVFKWIAEYSRCPVGFLVTGAAEGLGYVGEIGVLPSYRRKGIAQALLRRFAGFLKDRGIQVVELDVNVENTPAISLFDSCGFKKIRKWQSR